MDDYNYIGNYFAGQLSASETKQFDRQIQEDPAFAEEVAFYCNAVQEIKNQLNDEKKKRFAEIYRQRNVGKPIRKTTLSMNHWWTRLAAAAILIFMIAGTWFYLQPPTPKTLATHYLQQQLHVLPVSNIT